MGSSKALPGHPRHRPPRRWLALAVADGSISRRASVALSRMVCSAAGLRTAGRSEIGGTTCNRRDHLRVYNLASGATTDLTPSNPDSVVSISPEWRSIAYYRDGPPFGSLSDHPDALYIANFDGSGERALSTGTLPHGALRWSPDARWIAYVTRTDVHLLLTDGSAAPVRIASGQPSGVAWSPDSSKLLLWSATHLVEHDVATGADDTIATGNIFDAAWSPDGARIAYVAYSDAGFATVRLRRRRPERSAGVARGHHGLSSRHLLVARWRTHNLQRNRRGLRLWPLHIADGTVS